MNVTSVMLARIIAGLEARWLGSLPALRLCEQERIIGWLPRSAATIDSRRALPSEPADRHFIAIDLAPHARSPASRSRTGLLTCVVLLWTILGLNQ
uniref:hypothetical protein n=1 Tax=Saccharothrix mutabilis TaxID=33921 RepID=UPI0031D473AD